MLPASPETGLRRIAVVTDDASRLAETYASLLDAVAARKHRLRVYAMRGPEAAAAAWLAERGIETAPVGIDPAMSNPISDRAALKALAASLKELDPHALLALGDRSPMIGARAAGRARVRRTALVVETLSDLHLKRRERPTWLTRYSIRTALAAATTLLFHAEEDRRDALGAGILPPGVETAVIPGAGIDLERYPVLPLPETIGGVSFAMTAPLDRRQGVGAFLEAARITRRELPSTSFVLAGPEGIGPGEFPIRHLDAFREAVTHVPGTSDPTDILRSAHVVVAPVSYGGITHELLRGLAAGRPIITTATPGARSVVDERINGCLVPPSDPDALAAAFRSFLAHPELIPVMARSSRLKAERRFDARQVVPVLLAALGLGSPPGAA
jgi:glycosyltransferase involved in cell wall biosynthesis